MNLLMLEPSAAAQIEGAEVNAAGYPGAQWRGGQMTVDGSIATIDISGAMVYDKSLISSFLATVFGATLTPELQASLKAAAEDPKVAGVLLKVNSPGGMVAGTEEAGRLVAELAKKKPVVALVESMSASAAYWATSAASKVVALGKTVSIGSIGVLATVETGSDAKKVTLVSTQSPNKRMDAGTEEGKASLQAHIDSLAQVFIDSVAANRGKTSAQVQEGFGKGGVLLAEPALAAGMIDQVGTEADAIALVRSLAKVSGAQSAAASAHAENPTGVTMDTQQQVDTAAIQATATLAERTRIAAILESPEAKGREVTAQRLATKTGMSAEEATAVLSGIPVTAANGFAAAMNDVKNPDVKPGETEAATEQAEIDAEVDRILTLSGDRKKETK